MDLNKVMLIGRLTKDPETRTLQSGQSVATFSLATGRQWTDKETGQKKSQSEFHNVVAWQKLADIAVQYLRKGSSVYVEGRLQTRSWDDPSGKKQYRTEVVAENVIMLGGKANTAQQETVSINDLGAMPLPAQDDVNVDDLPF